jgi:transcriptional antiterminator NusG
MSEIEQEEKEAEVKQPDLNDGESAPEAEAEPVEHDTDEQEIVPDAGIAVDSSIEEQQVVEGATDMAEAIQPVEPPEDVEQAATEEAVEALAEAGVDAERQAEVEASETEGETSADTVDAPLVEDAAEEPEELEDVEEEIETVQEPDDDRLWYVVHCYSGYENKVRHNLEQRIETMGMKDRIFDVVVPTEEEIEIKDGKRRNVERRVFPGYILVQMLMDEDSWYVVRNTPGVTGFVGMGNEPTPLRPEEVSQIIKRMEAEAPRIKVTYKTGQKVRIIDGPFNDFIGTVSDIDMERAKVRVMVSFFGRETPVELDFLQVEKA